MNIKILDSWLREYLDTKATPEKIGEALSLTSVGVERIEKHNKDYIYDIEVTTNRPDLMSVIGLAREAAVILPQFGIAATYNAPIFKTPKLSLPTAEIHIKNNPKLVHRICAVVMEVTRKESPKKIQERLETTDIRSLNNIVDITNYVMREVGHPAHVFDYDRLTTKKLIIRESDPGEKIVTLDNKEYILPGGDIVADNGEGEIVDLLGVMGTANSVVTNDTKRILFFLDNNNPNHIRHTSMSLGIRTEAAQLNEKGVDPELMHDAFLRGIELYQEIADGKIVSELIDIFPNPIKPISIQVTLQQINTVIGVSISSQQSLQILKDLGFSPSLTHDTITAKVPSWRLQDVAIPEDLIEEIARVYGYHNLPSILPPTTLTSYYHMDDDQFYWEKRVKDSLKYWGFNEVYTYSMVSEDGYEGDPKQAVGIKNPLSLDHVYMRTTLIPSLLNVVESNTSSESLAIFELANTYHKRTGNLPDEKLRLAGVIKKPNLSIYEVKGVVEQLLYNLGVTPVIFTESKEGGLQAEVKIGTKVIGNIEQLDPDLGDFELDFQEIIQSTNLKRTYTPPPKYPPVIEDIRVHLDPSTTYGEVVALIKSSSKLVTSVELLDTYHGKKTFRIIYQHRKRNLTNEEVGVEREKIITALSTKLHAKIV